MLRKILAGFLLAGFTLISSGCVALLAGAGGTVLWQGGKIISEERGSMRQAVLASKAAFAFKKIKLTEEVTKKRVTQLRGEGPSGAKVAVDVFSVGSKNVRLEIRVGLGERIAARELLEEIKKQL